MYAYLGEHEVNVSTAVGNAGLLDGFGEDTRTTEVGLQHCQYEKSVTSAEFTHSNFGPELRVSTGQVLTSLNRFFHTTIDSLPVRTAEHGTSTEESQWIILGTGIVDGNVPQHIFANLLGQVNVDTQEVG